MVEALAGHGVEPYAVAWAESTAAGAPWACYGRCRCAGVLPDPAGTVVAAAVVAGGQVIRADRAELERMVAPADPARVRRRARLLVARPDAALDRPERRRRTRRPGWRWWTRRSPRRPAGELVLDDRAVLELAWALSDIRVRDAALLRNLGPAAAAAEQLWAALARELPDPEAAEPAALLAVAALLRGDGALANVALDRAERAWPGHRLTRLLRRAAEAGVRPDQLRAWLSGDAVAVGGRAAGPGGAGARARSRRRRVRPAAGSGEPPGVADHGGQLGALGRQPSSVRAASLDAMSTAGSPSRRGAVTAGIGWPVTARAASSTSRTEKPVPVPRLYTACRPGRACCRASRCASARSSTWM